MNSSLIQDKQRATLNSSQGTSHHLSSSSYLYQSSTGSSMPASFNVIHGQAHNESLAQARPQYQPGYLLSLAQSQAAPVTGGRHEEPFLIPTRAKITSSYGRNSPSDFGSESIFESKSKQKQREVHSDEDGPPASSVVDLVSEIHSDSRREPRDSNGPATAHKIGVLTKSAPSSSHMTLYVIVFGYPLARFTSTVTYFRSFAEGGTTEPEVHNDVENAFRIGYKQPWEAVRAYRKNGEIMSGEAGGRWMIGVKWMDPAAAEQIFGASVIRVPSQSADGEAPFTLAQEAADGAYDPSQPELQRADSLPAESPIIGVPITLVPSTSAFRRPAPGPASRDGQFQTHSDISSLQGKSKGMLGQVSDLIFGW